MKIVLFDNNGIELEAITEIEQYHLPFPADRAALWSLIRSAIDTAQSVETDRELAQSDLKFTDPKVLP